MIGYHVTKFWGKRVKKEHLIRKLAPLADVFMFKVLDIHSPDIWTFQIYQASRTQRHVRFSPSYQTRSWQTAAMCNVLFPAMCTASSKNEPQIRSDKLPCCWMQPSGIGISFRFIFNSPRVSSFIVVRNCQHLSFYGSLLRKFPLATSESPFGGEGGKIRQVADAVLCLFIFLTQSLSSIKKEIESWKSSSRESNPDRLGERPDS